MNCLAKAVVAAVTVTDASMVQQHVDAVTTLTPLQVIHADVNSNGLIQQDDADAIASFASGSGTLSCCQN